MARSETSEYELRVNGQVIERSSNAVDLYWKARRAVSGTMLHAEVESVRGFYSILSFYGPHLKDWERTPQPAAA